MRKITAVMSIAVFILFAVNSICFAKTNIIEQDRIVIYNILDKLSEAIIHEDINLVMSLFSPHAGVRLLNEAREAMQGKFSRYDYIKYRFELPPADKIKIIESDSKVFFNTKYLQEYKIGASSLVSCNGLSAKFVMEKINGEWLILDTDFYTQSRAAVILVVTFVCIFILVITIFIYWLRMLLNCIQRDFSVSGEKTAWIILIIFTNVLGAIIYDFIIKRKTGKSRDFGTG